MRVPKIYELYSANNTKITYNDFVAYNNDSLYFYQKSISNFIFEDAKPTNKPIITHVSTDFEDEMIKYSEEYEDEYDDYPYDEEDEEDI